MSASYPTKLYLAMKSGNLCAMKNCRKSLTSEGVISDVAVLGQAAHIYGENPGTKKKAPSARYLKDMTDNERNHYDNLIYLCPSCHTKIDKQEADYPGEELIQLKQEHENWVEEQLDNGMSEVTFAELEIAANAIASGKHSENGDLVVLPPDEKIIKNSLSTTSRSYILMGLSRSSEVTKFLSDMAQLDDNFPIRLRDGFKNKYSELKLTLAGDELFMGMLEFAQSSQRDFKQQAASLALLSHLFNLCEVFEK
jgi:hypothetical protein